jgi:UDP-N-acetylglucosamine acyltransferase
MSNRIHPTAVISEGVELGDGNTIGPFTVVHGPAVIGDDNWIGSHVVIGAAPESRGVEHPVAWDGERGGVAGVRIGDRTTLREFTIIQQGTCRTTTIADDCYLMHAVGVGHDALVDHAVTCSPGVVLAGHVQVWPHANLGMNATLHQHGAIGPGAMIGMNATVPREAAAFSISVGVPARTRRINDVGLARLGCSESGISQLDAYLNGRREFPDELPSEVAAMLKLWVERDRG